jgi:hypothetical protein
MDIMTEGKITFKVGVIEFSAEGEQEWVAQQLDKNLVKSPELMNVVPQIIPPQVSAQLVHTTHSPMVADPEIANKPLASFLKEKDSTTNQNKKFLATAVWLEARGKNRLTPKDIAKALKESNQSRLGNASQCLNNNVNKGYCERDGKEFFVTEDGKNSL